MSDFAFETLSSRSGASAFYFIAGFIVGFVSTALVPLAVIGLFLRPPSKVLARLVQALAIILAISSAICACAYVGEEWIAFHTANRYERYTFLYYERTTAGLLGWFYWFSVLSMLLPQLFWWRRMRRSFWVILLIAIGVSSNVWYEKAVVAITSYSQQDTFPSSWLK